ncbi:DUF4411 family protein [Candidatus Saccharibacteria bacterium]|nr:DUF4411 family protein [Candidatus Saccharibacteria bacterium]
MTRPATSSLLANLATHCIDTNVFFNFWKLGPDEPYGKDVFKTQWEIIEKKIETGEIIAPMAVHDEIMKGKEKDDPLKAWAKQHEYMFVELDDDQVAAMGPIVTEYPIYNDLQRGSYADLCVVALGKARGLTVITSERETVAISKKNPRIPNVCSNQGVKRTSVIDLFRQEGRTF